LLRPLSERLHFARKDQEHCRQILTALSRMVPGRGRRHINKRSLLGRECFPDALWILSALDSLFHGEFASAREYWSRAGQDAGQAAAPAQKREVAKSRPAPGPRTKSSRPSEGAARKADKSDGPPPKWDDGEYFFAALPSVPDMPAEEGQRDRYGADAVAPRPEPDKPPQDQLEQDKPEQDKPKRKRRPRRRRRPSSGARKQETPDDSGGENQP
jgi:hypothetical protein